MQLLSRLSLLPALALAAIAAGASIRGQETTARITGSGWFIVLAGSVALLALVTAVKAAACRPRSCLFILTAHLGLTAGLAGVGANQLLTRSGYLLLEAQAGPQNCFLDRSLRTVRPLPLPIQLDSITRSERRGFRPAPLAWLSTGQAGSFPVAYSRPLRHAGSEFLLLRPVDPGTPLEVELSLDRTNYLLLHNQHVRLADGRDLWSHSWEPSRNRLALAVGDTLVWLASGDTLRAGNTTIALGAVFLTRRPGAVFAVRFTRLRWLVFAGFGLMLFGTAGMLLGRKPD
uniref:ResB-like domain-containing protein n=1 Tax=candidate division WOR-3 bacterium TaxID=2052148 RepID=A0A7C4CAR0_UNCW3